MSTNKSKYKIELIKNVKDYNGKQEYSIAYPAVHFVEVIVQAWWCQ